MIKDICLSYNLNGLDVSITIPEKDYSDYPENLAYHVAELIDRLLKDTDVNTRAVFEQLEYDYPIELKDDESND